MADNKKSTIVIASSLVGCVVTLLTCGMLIGNVQGDVRNLAEDTTSLKQDVKSLASKQSTMESKQSYLEGVVSTKLDNIQNTVSKMEIQVNGLEGTTN